MTEKPKVALVGAGAMGGALLRGWLGAGSIDARASAVFDPSPPEAIAALCKEYSLAVNPDNATGYDVLLLAVKPQMAETALPAHAAIAAGAIVVSVMAGKSVASIAGLLGQPKKVVRAMPNLPAAIGEGVTGFFATSALNDKDRALVDMLMGAVGASVWVEKEADIDIVTAVSGSGPAYFFLLTEALAEAGEAAGLSTDAAAQLARATFVGAGALLAQEARSSADMRRAVTSPGGTTEAALSVLDGDDALIRTLMKKAITAAAKRAGELSD